MTKSMLEVPAAKVQREFGLYQDEAMLRPVGITRHGRVRVVMVPAEDYARMAARDRRALLVEELDDAVARQLIDAEPSPESFEVERELAAAPKR